MKQFDYTIQEAVGIHARPAGLLVKEVKKYKSAIDAAADMLLGRVDCVIIDELPAKKIRKRTLVK